MAHDNGTLVPELAGREQGRPSRDTWGRILQVLNVHVHIQTFADPLPIVSSPLLQLVLHRAGNVKTG